MHEKELMKGIAVKEIVDTIKGYFMDSLKILLECQGGAVILLGTKQGL